ncbi:MAG: hypothetical protein A2X52_03170 [Candidatus Rokubacteria bacterium GWC2_70_16]|nr:MAG: hypothetical protein A2X52_03170 [Candidatus Rokubacteria bacterium GWC2_70_16]OGL14048.1 MAG: hypothetical protein A3K12_07675 [Candidatus Rokubacteria bacterium RIFCSPLOWO2_12_FULL_71_19]
MRALIWVLLTGTSLLAGSAAAQTHGSSPAHGGAAPGHTAGHPQGHIEALRCEERFEEVVRQGLGFGMAFTADRNGYPGPTHVLELRERLRLTSEQEGRVRALVAAMHAESRPAGAALLEAEARLRALFETKRAAEESLQAQVAESERLRAGLRLVHLRYHLRTREILTEAQRAVYHAARWDASR